MIWHEMKGNEMSGSEIKRNEMEWSEVKTHENENVIKWNEIT